MQNLEFHENRYKVESEILNQVNLNENNPYVLKKSVIHNQYIIRKNSLEWEKIKLILKKYFENLIFL